MKESESGTILLLNNAYGLRANWHFIKNGQSRNAKSQQAQYKKLRGAFLKFLKANVGAERYEQFESTLQDLDSFFEPRQLEKGLYPKLPRKMNSSTSEDVYLQMRLVEDMYIYFKDANYRLVAITVDALLNKDKDNPTTVDKVQHNTKLIADVFTKRIFDMKIND